MMNHKILYSGNFSLLAAAALIGGCNSSGERGASSLQSNEIPGDAGDTAAFNRIAPDDVIYFSGTEPFWSGKIENGEATYATPDVPHAPAFQVVRFAGRGGVTFSGEVDSAAFDLLVSEGNCSDGMSEQHYPFTATLNLGAQTLTGCAYTSREPYQENGPQ